MMNLEIEGTQGCCAVDEIIGSMDNKDSERFMWELCRVACQGSGRYNVFTGQYTGQKLKLATHYLFTGVVGYTNTKKKSPSYCQNLKKFINDNGLGEVVESTGAPNHRYHKSHIVKAFIFTPDVDAMKSWWKKNEKKYKENEW